MAPEPVTEPIVVRREIGLDRSSDEAWRLLGGPEGWASWLVDEADVEVTTGARGTVTDDGIEREVAVTHVEAGRSVEFVWWVAGDPATASSVSLIIDDGGDGPVILRVVESFPPQAAWATASALRWEVRAVAAWACRAGVGVGV